MATIGCSSLPKVALSYKWIISDAKVFLKNCEGGLRSPEFSTPLQSTTTNGDKASWHLLIEVPKKATTRSPHRYHARFDNEIKIKMPSITFELSLCQEGIIQKLTYASAKEDEVLISNCMFSILNSETGEQLHSIKPYQMDYKCTVNKSSKKCVTVNLHDDSEISKYFFMADTLTIQVSATLLGISSPAKTTLRVDCIVPPDNVRGDLFDSYRDEVFVDASIRCGDKVFKVHKVILASQSPVLKKMFEIDMKEKRSGVIEISDPNVSPEVVSDLVTYLYTGDAPGIRTQAKELLKIAHLYEIPRLLRMCENELQKSITPSSVCNLLLLAELHTAQNLKEKCIEFIHSNFRSLHKTQGWKDLKDNEIDLLFEALFRLVTVSL